MLKTLLVSAVSLALMSGGLLLIPNPPATLSANCATCKGSSPCNACRNCKSCGHCKKNGGTCGACSESAGGRD